METVARTGKACRTPAMTTNKCRRSASTTTSTRKTRHGFVFRWTRAYKPPTQIQSTLCLMRSPQPLYSFAAGYTHFFSQNLVNSFNTPFSWYESLVGPANVQSTVAAFPIVLQGSGANAPFTTVGGL